MFYLLPSSLLIICLHQSFLWTQISSKLPLCQCCLLLVYGITSSFCISFDICSPNNRSIFLLFLLHFYSITYFTFHIFPFSIPDNYSKPIAHQPIHNFISQFYSTFSKQVFILISFPFYYLHLPPKSQIFISIPHAICTFPIPILKHLNSLSLFYVTIQASYSTSLC